MKAITTEKMTLAGAGIALALFGVFGLQPGAFIGGIIGVNMAGHLLGLPVAQTLAARLIVGAGMLMAIMITGLMFTTAGASVGYLSGKVVELSRSNGHKDEARTDHILSH